MAESIVGRVGHAIAQYPQALGHVAGVADALVNGTVQVAIVGKVSDPSHKELVKRVSAGFVPALILAGGEPVFEGQPSLVHGREPIGGRPTAYVCRAFTCELPSGDPDVVERQVKQLVGDASPAAPHPA